MSAPDTESSTRLGIVFILVGAFAISVNDVMIKALSGEYPLHQMVFVRSAIGISFSLIFVQFEGGWRILKTDKPLWHLSRGLLVVAANMTFYAAVAVLPLAEATALFFVAPLFITLLSIPLLGEKVGAYRMGAVAIGFGGIVLMMRPWSGDSGIAAGQWALLLPVLAALCYACMQILTRRLGATSKASAMAVYIQGTFLIISGLFFVVAGDGRFAEGVDSPSLVFLFRAWVWPEQSDIPLFLVLGATAGVIGYALSQAYRSADAAVIAPFEYIVLPLAIFWGWSLFGEWPGPQVLAGIALIVGAGVFVFVRERIRDRSVATRRPLRRH
ncbi:MAG: DMT family transporter [Pseudomonadota bacterium]